MSLLFILYCLYYSVSVLTFNLLLVFISPFKIQFDLVLHLLFFLVSVLLYYLSLFISCNLFSQKCGFETNSFILPFLQTYMITRFICLFIYLLIYQIISFLRELFQLLLNNKYIAERIMSLEHCSGVFFSQVYCWWPWTWHEIRPGCSGNIILSAVCWDVFNFHGVLIFNFLSSFF